MSIRPQRHLSLASTIGARVIASCYRACNPALAPSRPALTPKRAFSGRPEDQHDPFGHPGQPQGYVAYRPDYPTKVFDRILNEAKTRGLLNKGSTLVDVATGTGKVISALAPHFESAIGFDRSKAQLAVATPGPNIKYVEADAYAIPLPSASASVVTIGMGLHWLQVPRFTSECHRLLVPNGLLVVLGYTTYDMFASHPHLHALFCPWWDQFRPYDLHDITLLESAFANVDFAPLQEVYRSVDVEVMHMTPDAFVKYLGTWSPVAIWRRKNPTAPDKLEELRIALIEAARKDGLQAGDDGQLRLPVRFPFFLVCAQSMAA